MMIEVACMLDVKAVSGFPGKRISSSEAALNGTTPDPVKQGQDPASIALDRLEAAMARIAQAQYHRPSPVPAAEPAWAADVAARLDALIAELRRALSGEQA